MHRMRFGYFLLVPFLVLVLTDQPGLVGLLGHHPPSVRTHKLKYGTVSLRYRRQLLRCAEMPPRVCNGYVVPDRRFAWSPFWCKLPTVLAQAATTDPLYGLMSLQI